MNQIQFIREASYIYTKSINDVVTIKKKRYGTTSNKGKDIVESF